MFAITGNGSKAIEDHEELVGEISFVDEHGPDLDIDVLGSIRKVLQLPFIHTGEQRQSCKRGQVHTTSIVERWGDCRREGLSLTGPKTHR